MKRLDVENSLSVTKTRLGHIPASDFAKSNWNSIRGMDPVSEKFLVQIRLVNKRSGDPAFADTRLDVGLSSVISMTMSRKRLTS